MANKERVKLAGKNVGSAMTLLGKTIVRTAYDVSDRLKKWANDEPIVTDEKDTNVFNDGSWDKTSKALESAFSELGKAIINKD
ncbi:MAG: hypothetical protein MJ236_01740 [Clostridia bacterium]|nr:hypothetical protein [Clostridia bacterium]